MSNGTVETMDLQQAAAFLKIHPVTLSIKAATGEIQGAKIGKRWVFLEVDLIEHIRSQYKTRALQGEQQEIEICHSTNAKTRHYGGSKSLSVDSEYKAALGLAIKPKRKNSMTS